MILYQSSMANSISTTLEKIAKPDVALLKAGDLFLLPANVPHSPRRADGSWTFVVERTRQSKEQDRFIWTAKSAAAGQSHETTVRFNEPSDAVATATAAMKADPKLATCSRCGGILSLRMLVAARESAIGRISLRLKPASRSQARGKKF